MDPKIILQEIWQLYNLKHEEEYFYDFLAKFHQIYGNVYDGEFLHLANGIQKEGPSLSEVPEDLLPVLGIHLYNLQEKCANQLSVTCLKNGSSIIQCLSIICRNFDNIPFVASCDFICDIVTLSSGIVNLKNLDSDIKVEVVSFLHEVFYLFECLYDPYSIWRLKHLGRNIRSSDIKFQPASLHIEFIPFFYDCFAVEVDQWPSDIPLHCMHMFGALLSGAKHNAIKAICPATLETLFKILSNVKYSLDLKDLVLDCIIQVIQELKYSNTEQQVELSAVIVDYTRIIETICEYSLCQNFDFILRIFERTVVIVESVDGNFFQETMGNIKWINFLTSITGTTELEENEIQNLAIILIQIISIIFSKFPSLKQNFDYDWLSQLLKHQKNLHEDLLLASLSLLCEKKVQDESILDVQNPLLAKVLFGLLPDLQWEQQEWLADKLFHLFLDNLHNQTHCCAIGCVATIVSLLEMHSKLSNKTSGLLIKTLEILGRHSISAHELKQLLLLLRLDEDGSQFPLTTQLIHALSSMAKTDGYVGAMYFWNFQNGKHGLTVPGIRRWPGYGFSFHVWLRLDICTTTENSVPSFRRQLYSFYTSTGMGFEAFFLPDGTLVVAVCIKKEFLAVSLMDNPLDDGLWHCIDICHASSRRPFSQSHLTVFIDGRLKTTAQLKCPSFSEPFTYCRIGSPGPKTNVRGVEDYASMSASDKILSTLPAFFSLPVHLKAAAAQDPAVKVVIPGLQDKLWGVQRTLNGQISSIAVFSEALQPSTVKLLYTAGINNLTAFLPDDNSEISDAASKLVFYYHAKASQGSVCSDLSPTPMYEGHVTALRFRSIDCKDSVNCIGGIQALFPILENAIRTDLDDTWETGDAPKRSIDEDEDWVVLPSSRYSDEKLEQNQLAGFLIMLRNFIHNHQLNQEQLVRSNAIGVVGSLLQKVSGSLIDVNVLMSVQLLVECVSSDNGGRALLNAIYQHILFDFRIWNRSDFPVRIGHIQYLSTIIKDDRRYFRKKYGVQFLLDMIRYFYSHNPTLNNDDMQIIRVSLLGLVKYYIAKEFSVSEMNAMLGFLCAVKQAPLVSELLDMLLSVLESRHCRDQVFLLLFEPGCAELLYGLLLNRSFSAQLKQKVLKVIYVLLKTERVYERYKNRLRLQDVGIAGLTSFLQGHLVSDEMVFLLLDITLLTGKQAMYQGLLALLNFIKSYNLKTKLRVSAKLLEIVKQRPNAAQLIGKQQSWQDSILYLLVKQPISLDSVPVQIVSQKNCHIPQRNSQLMSEHLDSLCEVAVEADPSIPLTETSGDESPISSSPVIKNFNFMPSNVFEFETQSIGASSKASSAEDISTSVKSDIAIAPSQPLSATVGKQPSEPELDDNWSFKGDEEDQEHTLLCNVATVLAMVFWNGVEGSDKHAWLERGRLFTCINFLALNNDLFISHLELKRLILEHALQSAISDLNEPGQVNLAYNENARELMKWLYDFVVVDPNKDHSKKLSTELLEGVLTLLETLLVYEDAPGADEWTEMAHMGLGLLLSCAGSDSLELCAIATPKLHALVQTRSLISLEESCYILGSINTILLRDIQEGNHEHYSFLIPVLKALLECIGSRLITQRYLPGLPSNQPGPTFFEDFQEYSQTDEWTIFINRQVKPMMDKYMLTTLKPLPDSMNDFWNLCYEASMTGMHKRNREWGECKLCFQSQILEPFNSKRLEESNRYQQWIMQLMSQSLTMRKRWQQLCLYLKGSRGPWKEKKPMEKQWKLSSHENFSRMRLKLVPNLNFTSHTDASQLRDNLGINRKTSQPSTLPLALTLEAKVSDMQEDSLTEEDLIGAVNLEVETHDLKSKEKLVLSENCELVTLMTVVKGRFEITTNHICFYDCSPVREEVDRQDFKWSLTQIREIHLRRYNLRRSALELFLIDQTNYFLNFTTKTRNKVYSRLLSLRPPNLVYHSSRSPAEFLKASGLTQKWVQREISNFDYVMQLNTIAGRSYNDLSQYPVFPWIISNYASKELDLEDPSVFRDLSKPIGVVNPKKIPEVKAKYEEFEDATGTFEKFHYGTHYSNSAGVLHYLVRMEPFTSLHVELQSGRFDVADRQFHSIPGTWRMLMESTSDVKELIPEFFYLPEFLSNLNNFDLGRLQENKKKINGVELPNWAKSPQDFIYKHRKALESEYVSAHLHEWIDLIFGYKQKGAAAIEALNVFFYCSYEGAVDLDAITTDFEREQLEKMINNFGQTPCQLLKEPHPRRLNLGETEQRQLKEVMHPPSILSHITRLKAFFIEVSTEIDPLIFINIPRSQARSFIQQNLVDNLITISEGGILGVHGWLPYDKFIPNYFTFEKDPTLTNAKVRRKVSGSLQPGININCNLFTLTHDGRLLFSGGHWDNSIRVYNIARGKTTSVITGHLDIVLCLALDYFGSRLISGSQDTTCIIWEVLQQGGISQGIAPKPFQILYGHDAPVTCVAIMSELDMAVSGSEDGIITVHTIRDGIYIRTLDMCPEIKRPVTVGILDLSEEGHIAAVAHIKNDEQQSSIVCIFSINGNKLASEKSSNIITAMLLTGSHIITADDRGQLSFREMHDLRSLSTLSLHVPVTHLTVTTNASHVLAALRDGKLIVVGLARKNEERK